MEPQGERELQQADPANEPSKRSTSSDVKIAIPKKALAIGLGVAVLAAVAGGAYAFSQRDSHDEGHKHSQVDTTQGGQTSQPQPSASASAAQDTPANQSRFLSQNGQGCTERDVTFTNMPIPDDQLGYIDPLGMVLDGHVTPTDHVYVHPKNSRVPDNTYDAIMPADGTIVNVSAMPAQYVGDSNQQTASEDHRLTIMHSCRYFSIFIHVHKLDPALSSVTGTLAPNTSKNVSIPLKAGDKVGKAGGNGFDWTLVDTETRLAGFISPELYDGESWKIHTIDPFSVYTGEKKATYEALSLRSVAPFGGKIDYDVPGKLIGNWFREGTGGYSGLGENGGGRYWDGHLSIAPSFIDPASTIVSLGNWTNNAARQFVAKGTFDPAAISPASGPRKIELLKLSYVQPSGAGWTGNEKPVKGIKPAQSSQVEGTLLVEVLEGEKLKVEKFPGKQANQVSGFTEAAQTYQR